MLPFSLTRYRAGLLGAAIVILAVSCIDPPWPGNLILQHIPTTIGVALLLWGGARLELSDRSYTCIILFLLLHIIGARWLYSFVPYDSWAEWLTGRTISDLFGFERNHYDRLVHFGYGLLLVHPIREMLERYGRVRIGLARWFAVEFILGTSAIYELLEWLIALVLSPESAEAYNGQQGDMWDAQKDMALAAAGALLGTGVTLIGRKGRRAKENTLSPAQGLESKG